MARTRRPSHRIQVASTSHPNHFPPMPSSSPSCKSRHTPRGTWPLSARMYISVFIHVYFPQLEATFCYKILCIISWHRDMYTASTLQTSTTIVYSITYLPFAQDIPVPNAKSVIICVLDTLCWCCSMQWSLLSRPLGKPTSEWSITGISLPTRKAFKLHYFHANMLTIC